MIYSTILLIFYISTGSQASANPYYHAGLSLHRTGLTFSVFLRYLSHTSLHHPLSSVLFFHSFFRRSAPRILAIGVSLLPALSPPDFRHRRLSPSGAQPPGFSPSAFLSFRRSAPLIFGIGVSLLPALSPPDSRYRHLSPPGPSRSQPSEASLSNAMAIICRT